MSPHGKSKSKSARSASAGRNAGTSKKGGQSMAPLWIAAILIGAIAVAMGVTIHKQGQKSAAPSAGAESGAPQGTDPGAAPSTSGTSNPGQSPAGGQSQNQSGTSSHQVLTN